MNIERQVLLKAPRDRVWKALINADEFGSWFGVAFRNQAFEVGKRVTGQITYPGYTHLVFSVLVETIEPEAKLAFRWHPYAVDATKDYSNETPTLVEFTLKDAEVGTLLTLMESGFDKVPLARRVEAFRMNSGGWDEQMKNIARHVAQPSAAVQVAAKRWGA